MMKVLPIVDEFLKVTRKYIPLGSTLVVACSGGADSVVLTDVLSKLRDELDLKLVVVHVEHGIRGDESLRDAQFTEQFCQERGLDFVCRSVDAPSFSLSEKQSLEEAARNLRFAVLFEEAEKLNADYIVAAHHADDQAETFLLRVLRGGGSRGLGAIREKRGKILRPFLTLFRAEIEAYCEACGLQYCTDSTNEDLSYLRNKVRKRLVPLLEEMNPNIRKTLLKEAELLQTDSECLDEMANVVYEQLIVVENDVITCDTDKLLRNHKAVYSRVVRKMLWEASDSGEISYNHVSAVLQMVTANKSGKILSLPGCVAHYAYGKLSISKRDTETDKENLDFDIKALSAVNLEEIKSKTINLALNEESAIELSYVEGAKPATDKHSVAYPWELLKGPLQVRYRQNGDIFFPYGGIGKKKLKDYFIDAKIEYSLRNKQMLLADGSSILWLIGNRSAGWHKNDEVGSAWLVAKLLR